VPMLYEMSTFTIRNLLGTVAEEQEKRLGKQAIVVYPGVSRMGIGRSGELQSPGFVFFNLNLARDAKLDAKLEKKEETEDLNFGAQ